MSEDKIQTIKSAPPPGNLPVLGKVDPKEVSFLGKTNYVAALEEKRYVFGLKRADRLHHLYVVGKAGVGKSKFLEILARQDIAHGYGLCFIDPNGDIVKSLLDFVPEERIDDVVLLDIGERVGSLAFNPLAEVPLESRHQLAQDLVEIFRDQFGSAWTPRLEHILRFSVLALMDYPGANLSSLLKLLTDGEFRGQVASASKDDLVKRFFLIEYDNWQKNFYGDYIMPLINKLNQLFVDPLLGPLFATSENRFNFEKIINEGKIFLVGLGRGRTSDESVRFFGSLVLAKVRQAGMSAARIRSAARKPFYIYLDDFDNLVSEQVRKLLSDGRKYGLATVLSHQYLAQLPENMRPVTLGSAGSIVIFRVGGADAEKLESEMAPIFKVKDMINLGQCEFYIKLMIDGQISDSFSAETLKVLPPVHPSYREKIIKLSNEKYGS